MNVVVANTQREGKAFLQGFFKTTKGFKVCSTWNSIAGHRFDSNDLVYVLTDDSTLIKCLMPALQGASVFVMNDWIVKR